MRSEPSLQLEKTIIQIMVHPVVYSGIYPTWYCGLTPCFLPLKMYNHLERIFAYSNLPQLLPINRSFFSKYGILFNTDIGFTEPNIAKVTYTYYAFMQDTVNIFFREPKIFHQCNGYVINVTAN